MIVVRDAEARDAYPLAKLHVLTWREAYWGLLPDAAVERETVARREAFWRVNIARIRTERRCRDENVILAWDAADEPIGYVWAGPARHQTAGWDGEIYMLYVRNSRQRGGVGRALMAEAARSLVRRGLFRIGLWVLADNGPARAFYEALGGVGAGARVERMTGGDQPVEGYAWEDAGVLLKGSLALR